MEINDKIAYSEVDEILDLLEDEYAKRIPEKIRTFIKEERDNKYKPMIDVDKPLLEQNISREAMILLAVVYLNYLCDSEQEKQELLNEFAQNENEKKKIEERYNPDNLFKKREKIISQNAQEIQMIEYKEKNFIQKILSKIKAIFMRNK